MHANSESGSGEHATGASRSAAATLAAFHIRRQPELAGRNKNDAGRSSLGPAGIVVMKMTFLCQALATATRRVEVQLAFTLGSVMVSTPSLSLAESLSTRTLVLIGKVR